MNIVVANDNGMFGYVCYQIAEKIYVRLWAGNDTIKLCYDTHTELVKDLKTFIGSPLAVSCDINKAKEFMASDFLEFVGHRQIRPRCPSEVYGIYP